MKKTLLSLFALATMLFATSCSQTDEFGNVIGGKEVTVTFSAELPQEIATRVYSDGHTAQDLHYAVYVQGATNPKFFTGTDGAEVVKFGDDLKATVTFTLATGVSYDVIFWAQSPDATSYTLDWSNKTMTIDYASMVANDENNDAFYAYVPGVKVNGALNQDVTLYRPFAQINLGTNDFDEAEAAGLFLTRSSMKVTVNNVLNFATGVASGEAEVEIGKGYFDRNEKFPVDGYEYLEMNYVLAGKDKTTTTCTFNVYQYGFDTALDNTITVSNVPIQRNYRTNIYGSLLTDEAIFNVIINPDYVNGLGSDEFNVKL